MGSDRLPPLPDPSKYDVVVAAGDISYGLQGVRWLDRYFPQDKPIIFVPGNHEYYTADFDEVKDSFVNYTGRVKILDPGSVVIDGYTFLGATMWSDLKLKGYHDLFDFQVQNSIADFKWGFTPERMRQIHTSETHYLTSALVAERVMDNIDQTIVITHFVPTQMCVHPKWVSSPLNPYFTNDQDWIMEEYNPAAWIFGHTHDRFDIAHPSGVRVVGNPFGYVGETPNFTWKILEV